ncbi:MAG: hypothetical protein IIB09_05130, partial [Bacteroidetes bacterium]|nr:hypothetical protein [Bacteroidota bacterium]
MTVKTAVRRLQLDLGQLIERHDTAKSLTDYSVYANDPIGFIRDVLHADPWDRQLDIAEAVRDHPLIVVRSCNAAGKDWIAAHLALWWVYARKGLVLMTGPTERQVKEIAMGEVARAFSRARDLPGELYATALRLGRDETAGILAFTSTEASKLTGHHADRILAILTEAQGVPDWAWEALMACAVGDEDRLLAVGNPLEPSGTFFTVSRSPDWCAIRISAEEHPNLVQGRTVIPGGVTQAMARRFANAYGRNSSIYTSRVLGEFPDQGDEALFRRSWLDAAVARWHELGSEVDGSLVVAVDPARYGPDATGIAVARGSVVQELEAWAGASDLMATTKRVCALLERLGVRRAGGVHCKVVVDVVGLGVGVCDRLRELGYWTV